MGPWPESLVPPPALLYSAWSEWTPALCCNGNGTASVRGCGVHWHPLSQRARLAAALPRGTPAPPPCAPNPCLAGAPGIRGVSGEGARAPVAAAAAPRSPRAEQVPSSSGVSCARGARVPAPAPTSPNFGNSHTPAVLFRGGERVPQWAPGSQPPGCSGALLPSPPFAAAVAATASVLRERDVLSLAESASPGRGARALLLPAPGDVRTGAGCPPREPLRGDPQV